MATAFYFLTLGLASGVGALWGRRMLGDMGLVHGFEPGLWVCVCLAAGYLAVQCAFRGALMLLMPSRARSLSIAEILSQAAALLLVPSLLGLSIPIPYTTLQRMEPLFHLGAFAGLHGFFKLMAFYAAVQGRRAGRLGALPWFACAGVAVAVFGAAAMQYMETVHQERPTVAGESVPFVVGNAYADACLAPENTRVLLDVRGDAGDYYSFLVAPAPGDDQPPATIYISVAPEEGASFSGLSTNGAQQVRTLHPVENEWTEIRFARADFPDNAGRLGFSWGVESPDSLMQRLGLQPPAASDRVMLVSGPWRHSRAAPDRPPAVVLIVVEGLGAENMSLYGYQRNTTPQLAERAAHMMRFEEVYTPAPEHTAASMSLLTGRNPLAHGYHASHEGPLPEDARSLVELFRKSGYFTVAFTEGRGTDRADMVHGTDFARGFVVFDDYFPLQMRPARSRQDTEPALPLPAGAHVTLQKAAAWIQAHAHAQYFVFIRLRELRNPQHMPRHGEGFIGRGRTPTPLDVYDTAITYIDRQLSTFLDTIDTIPEAPAPAILITSTHGFDFTEPGRGAWRRGGPGRRSLHESALRIPLLMRMPGRRSVSYTTPVSLLDIAPTLAAVAGHSATGSYEGLDILRNTSARPCISLMGDPVALSIRSGRWRFSWQSGMSPYTLEQVQAPAIIEFIDILRYRNDLAPVDNIRREPRLVEAFQDQLRAFLEAHHAAENVHGP